MLCTFRDNASRSSDTSEIVRRPSDVAHSTGWDVLETCGRRVRLIARRHESTQRNSNGGGHHSDLQGQKFVTASRGGGGRGQVLRGTTNNIRSEWDGDPTKTGAFWKRGHPTFNELVPLPRGGRRSLLAPAGSNCYTPCRSGSSFWRRRGVCYTPIFVSALSGSSWGYSAQSMSTSADAVGRVAPSAGACQYAHSMRAVSRKIIPEIGPKCRHLNSLFVMQPGRTAVQPPRANCR
ncbi:unnamed protein product [Acanthosepion pharaonis]|uniref:Uncharacterized protein n=1 Tax=Acanthosepion pharaonis TaxID=158019 RepID=A0A812BZX5_ACAPH|nr:unnamed protein product [Sepia pharaonis]